METTSLTAVLLSAAAADGAGGMNDISDFTYGSVQITGTFVADVQLQVSNDRTNWIDFGTVLDAPAIRELDLYAGNIRAVVDNYVSGAVTATLVAKR